MKFINWRHAVAKFYRTVNAIYISGRLTMGNNAETFQGFIYVLCLCVINIDCMKPAVMNSVLNLDSISHTHNHKLMS